ncbi:hypothetical protein H5410_061725 [Solanum commersonii]|uniref:Uncharacterized protein n=1 Tax=Solanum commersonii TaxID=4109 RepID=A0A9J5W9G1_SOLCO|nr:hypothetical protein H5410_061725 [Solanum commersonii]
MARDLNSQLRELEKFIWSFIQNCWKTLHFTTTLNYASLTSKFGDLLQAWNNTNAIRERIQSTLYLYTILIARLSEREILVTLLNQNTNTMFIEVEGLTTFGCGLAVIKYIGKNIGRRSTNKVEFEASKFGMDWCTENGLTNLILELDSLLLSLRFLGAISCLGGSL